MFFRRKPPQPPSRDVAALVADRRRPAILIKRGIGSSHLGGTTNLPSDTRWPSKDGRLLTLLASIDLGEANASGQVSWLPASGVLLFFYDVEAQPWGFDPKDRGGWAVLHSTSLSSPPDRCAEPLPRTAVDFVDFESIPSWERVTDIEFSEAELDLLGELQDQQYHGLPQHQLGGYPSPVQGDEMEIEAHLASTGNYCGDAKIYSDPRMPEFRKDAQEWRLLLQFDTDDELGCTWGDGGKLYFWVREQDALAARFDDVWLVLQCF